IMNNENVTTDGGRDFVKEPPGPDDQDSTLDVSLRSLRLRRYETQSLWRSSEGESEQGPLNPEAKAANESVGHIIEENDEQTEVCSSSEHEEADEGISARFDELSQEVRRLGREMFRINRVSERNQEIFDEAITEIRQLSSTVALIPAQHNEAI